MHPTVRSQIKLWGFTPKRHLGEARPWWLDWLLKAWDGKSVSHALSFEFLAPVVSRFWHKMKSSFLPLCLLLAVFSVFWTPSAGLKTLHLGSCVIATNLPEMQTEFFDIRDKMVCQGGTLPICDCFSPSLLVFLCPPIVWPFKETGWGLLTRRMHSQETSVAHNLKVFWKGTLSKGHGKEGIRGLYV